MKKLFMLVAVMVLLVSVSPANAGLTERNTWVGHYGISTDGWGGTSNNGTISAEVPSGATVVAAYLYSATTYSSSLGNVTLGGTSVNFDDEWTINYFRTGIADVTSIVAPTINSGPGGVYDFSVTESLLRTDGEALVVIYEEASLPTATVAVLDGPQALTGDTFDFNYAEPVDTSDPDFFAEMRLGISFSTNGQKSNVLVNGDTVSNNAGNYDDGENLANGSLITVGGYDDDLLNTNTYAGDDERYDLTPFIDDGDTSLSVYTNNPSNDDNIFMAAFYMSGEAHIGPVVPEPGTMFLLGTGLLGFAILRRRNRKA
ncbi:MAG: PEP-CTERM sorting domain-containing protein [Desulfobacterales bacterium]|nr:PEP-CTERM sorting domain-containing protein [Desulfobacterales bacterium]